MNIRYYLLFSAVYSVVFCAKIYAHEIFSCDSRLVQSKNLLKSDESREKAISLYSIRDHLGVLDIGESHFQKLLKKALEYDQSSDPFFRYGKKYILKTKDKYYILFYEKDERNKVHDGLRCSIGLLEYAKDLNGFYSRDSYEGVTFDKFFLQKLDAIEQKSQPSKVNHSTN